MSWPGKPGPCALQASPRGKALLPLSSSLPQAPALLPAPQQWGQTSHSMQRPSGASPERAPCVRHPGAGPDPRLRFLPRAASCPITPCRSPVPSGSNPAPRGARVPPTPSSCAVFLPATSSSCRLGAHLAHGLHAASGMSLSRSSLPCRPHPAQGQSIAAAAQAARQRVAAVQASPAVPARPRASAPVSPVNSRYYSNNFPCMIDFFCQVLYSPTPSRRNLLRTGRPQYYL